ncbi:DUF6572 domain-containing protein [Kaistia sp. MMO-174]|uniref:DUF6572 domain-containing protein n=1 Tax=Kaistia sp. MMO-174 TaxID=3081256 RepID=UPI001AC7ACA8|nr:hypothetical protein [Hyphomicrobiales bacterium]
MTIDQTSVIDLVAFNPADAEFWLIVTDHMPWRDQDMEHLLLLQEKLNSYPSYIEGGQMAQDYPTSAERSIVIKLANAFPLSAEAEQFFRLAREKIRGAGHELRLRTFPNGHPVSRSSALRRE